VSDHINLRHPTMRELYKLAQAQGWRVEQHGTELAWYPPDKSVGHVITGMDPPDRNRALANSVAQLRRAGLEIPGRRGMPAQEEESVAEAEAEPIDPFVRSLADLIEEEMARRTANLEALTAEAEARATALANDNADLRAKLKECDEGIDQRAEQVALEAVRQLLAERRVPRT